VSLSKLKIFFSEGEEVLAALPVNMVRDPGWAGDDPQGQYAFCLQAMLKDMLGEEPDVAQDTIFWGSVTSFMTHAFGGYSPASDFGGWGRAVGFQNPKYIVSVLKSSSYRLASDRLHSRACPSPASNPTA
jgi:hypothetical protein